MMRDLAERRHGGDVAGLSDLLEHHQARSRQGRPYGSGHADHPELREACYLMLIVKNAMCLPLLSYRSGLCDTTLDKVTQVGEHLKNPRW